jgi:hypothetical protein
VDAGNGILGMVRVGGGERKELNLYARNSVYELLEILWREVKGS